MAAEAVIENGATMNLTDEQLSMLRHMLGINDGSKSRPVPCRDHCCVEVGDPQLVELERLGAVRLAREPTSWLRYATYVTTEAGRAAAIASFRTIQWQKKKRVYLRFLEISEVCPDLTFRDFLVREEFAEIRREA